MAKKAAEKAPSKMSIIRAAIGELGADAMPKVIAEYVKTKHGVEMTPKVVSVYKSTINRKAGGSRRPSGRLASNGAVSVSDLTAVSELVSRYGADQLGKVVRMLS